MPISIFEVDLIAFDLGGTIRAVTALQAAS
jgi:hypothetical protein